MPHLKIMVKQGSKVNFLGHGDSFLSSSCKKRMMLGIVPNFLEQATIQKLQICKLQTTILLL